jgi:LysR family glycine cleavage system transcriptional activator
MSRSIRGFGALPSFAAAARFQSFTEAAAELGVTQAAVSHQIRELEEQLAVKLFHRTGRAVRLTASGEILKKAVDGAFEEIAQAMNQLKPTKPSLRVTSAPSFASKWLVPRLDRFLEQVPDVDVFIDIQSRISELSKPRPSCRNHIRLRSFPVLSGRSTRRRICGPGLQPGPGQGHQAPAQSEGSATAHAAGRGLAFPRRHLAELGNLARRG